MTGLSDPPRLCDAALPGVRPGVRLPAYDRRAHGVGIAHLGLGAFHRAHQAVFTEEAMERAGGDWRIVGATMRGADAADRLRPQDGLYTLIERGPDGPRARVVGALAEALAGPADPLAVVERLSDPRVRIATLTVTEKGYGLDAASGGLDRADPAIARDLKGEGPPRNAVGLLAAALARRLDRGAAPLTCLSCDNLSGNGAMLARLVEEYARLRHPRHADRIAAATRFPDSMVDRITPAATEEDAREAAELTGLADRAPVATEPFAQWVIEDRFAGDRPRWEEAGALLVADVRPFEEAKLRLLNGSHSALAYLGGLAGHGTVDRAVADPALRRLVGRLMDEAAETLPPLPGLDVARYRESLMARFDNPALKHRTAQIAADGSRKLPPRLLAPLGERLGRGRDSPALTLAVAGWIAYGRARPLDDPLAGPIALIWERAGSDVAAAVRAVAALPGLFGPRLGADAAFLDRLAAATRLLLERGIAGALDATFVLEER